MLVVPVLCATTVPAGNSPLMRPEPVVVASIVWNSRAVEQFAAIGAPQRGHHSIRRRSVPWIAQEPVQRGARIEATQNCSLSASWMERGPPIWYSGLKPPLAPPGPRALARVCVDRPNSGLLRTFVGEPKLG